MYLYILIYQLIYLRIYLSIYFDFAPSLSLSLYLSITGSLYFSPFLFTTAYAHISFCSNVTEGRYFWLDPWP